MRTRQTALHSSAYTQLHTHRERVGKEKQEATGLSSATCMNKSAFAAIWSSVVMVL